MIWQCGSKAFDTRMPILMGILNVTPDSFSDGGRFVAAGEGAVCEGTASPRVDVDAAVACALQMKEEGALIIDVGGESTRPGAEPVSPEEELVRVLPVVKALAEQDICVSIDTRHALVAEACVQAGACIINDVSGFRDPAMEAVAASCDAGLIVMHCGGNAAGDQVEYDDVVAEVCDWLRQRTAALEAAGIAHDRICVDPGPGFGKTPKQTLELVRNIHEVRHLGYPVCAALSRKSYIGWAYKIDDPAQRDNASAAEALMAAELGAMVIRTHNVACTASALKDLRPYTILSLGSSVALVAEAGEETQAKMAQLNYAISDLCQIPDTQIIDISGFWGSEPAYYEDQEPFVNAAVLLRTGVTPKELLDYLHHIENSLGRVRTIPNGPRTCDLDIVDYQLYVSDNEILTLPHPRVCEREFVVRPIQQILPGHIMADGTRVELRTDGPIYGRAWRLNSDGSPVDLEEVPEKLRDAVLAGCAKTALSACSQTE